MSDTIKYTLQDIFPDGLPTKTWGARVIVDWIQVRVKLRDWRSKQGSFAEMRASEKLMTLAAFEKDTMSLLRRSLRSARRAK